MATPGGAAIFSPSTKARNELAARHFLARNKDARAGPLIHGGDGCIYANGSNHRLRISAGFYSLDEKLKRCGGRSALRMLTSPESLWSFHTWICLNSSETSQSFQFPVSRLLVD